MAEQEPSKLKTGVRFSSPALSSSSLPSSSLRLHCRGSRAGGRLWLGDRWVLGRVREQQQHRPREEADRPPERSGRVKGGVKQVTGGRLHPPGDRGDAEEADPIRFSAATRQPVSAGRHETQAWPASANASSLAIRKQIEPSASGVHTTKSAAFGERLASRAVKVVTLKSSVPASCTEVAHQSIRRGSSPSRRRCGVASGSRLGAALMHSTYCRYAADVNKIEPMK
jgi:hypothetical protein